MWSNLKNVTNQLDGLELPIWEVGAFQLVIMMFSVELVRKQHDY